MTNNPSFEIIWEKEITEISTHTILLSHKKTKAQILALQNQDTNKAFGISFTTLPTDSKGVAHILEHSVLAGSRKYPLKEPFIELIKSSLKTFVNAYTFPDKTVYPIASENETDLLNMMDVYLDGVFNPLLTKNILKQEGWHYELTSKDDMPIYNGVVFSEMKGAMSNPISLLEDAIMEGLYPDTVYRHNSGGDPKDIPKLTFEEFKAFHSKYYHPSNSKSFISGNMDLNKTLIKLDEYFNQFDFKQIDTNIKLQEKFDSSKIIEKSFPIGENEKIDDKYMYTINWSIDTSITTKDKVGLEIIDYILNISNASPLKKSLVEGGFAQELSPITFEMEVQQPYFSLGVKGANKNTIDVVPEKINEVLNNLSLGIEQNVIDSAINRVDFFKREADFGGEPRNIAYLRMVLSNWNYNKDPMNALKFRDEIDEIKAQIANGEQYLESLIKKYLINNDHRSIAKLVPDPIFSKKLKISEEEELKSFKNSLNELQIDQLIADTQELKNWQSRKDSKHDLELIPKLKVSDLTKTNKVLPIKRDDNLIVSIFTHDIETNDIIYFDLGFDLLSLPLDFSYIRLFKRALIKFGSQNMKSHDLSLNLEKYLGGITISPYISNKYKSDGEIIAKLFVRVTAIEENVPKMFELLNEILFQTDMDNKAKFLEILRAEKSSLEMAITSISASNLAGTRASSYINNSYAIKDKIGGIEYYKFLQKTEKLVEEDWTRIVNDLNTFKLYLQNNLDFYNIICKDEISKKLVPSIKTFTNSFKKSPQETKSNQKIKKISEAFTTSNTMNYCAQSIDLSNNYELEGSIYVINILLQTDYLWNKIRVQNGAYGGGCSIDLTNSIYSLKSWRDPNISKTYDVFSDIHNYLNQEFDQKDIESAIIGAISSFDQYLKPYERGFTALTRTLINLSDAVLNQLRQQILTSNINDIHKFGEVLSNIKKDQIVRTVIGNNEKIKEAKDKFDSIIPLN